MSAGCTLHIEQAACQTYKQGELSEEMLYLQMVAKVAGSYSKCLI